MTRGLPLLLTLLLFTANALGRLVETIAPTQSGATASTKFQYDAVGNQTRVEDGNGHATTFTYDHGNRVLLQTFANGDQVTSGYSWGLLLFSDFRAWRPPHPITSLDVIKQGHLLFPTLFTPHSTLLNLVGPAPARRLA